jgi:hypothetical protein
MKTLTHPQRKDLILNISINGTETTYIIIQTMHDGLEKIIDSDKSSLTLEEVEKRFIQKYSYK